MTNKKRAEIVERYLVRWEKDTNLNNFTPKAKKAIFNAARLAMYLGDSEISVAYLVFAGAMVAKSKNCRDLTFSNITADGVAKKIKKARGMAEYPTYLAFEDFTSHAKLIITYAKLFGDGLVTSDDILTGLRHYNITSAYIITRDFSDGVSNDDEEEEED